MSIADRLSIRPPHRPVTLSDLLAFQLLAHIAFFVFGLGYCLPWNPAASCVPPPCRRQETPQPPDLSKDLPVVILIAITTTIVATTIIHASSVSLRLSLVLLSFSFSLLLALLLLSPFLLSPHLSFVYLLLILFLLSLLLLLLVNSKILLLTPVLVFVLSCCCCH